MTKTEEITMAQFEEQALSTFPDEMNHAKNAQKIVVAVYEKSKRYQIKTSLAWLRTALQSDIRDASAKQITCLITGCRDKKGSNRPINYACMMKNQRHFEAASWDLTTETADGTKMVIPYPAIVEMLIAPDKKNYGLEIKRIIKMKKLTNLEMFNQLVKMEAIIDPSDIPAPNREAKIYPLVATEITIDSIKPSMLNFDTKTTGPVMMPDDNKPPIMDLCMGLVGMPSENSTIVTAYIDPRKTGHGLYDITDLKELAQDVMKESSVPEDQADFISGAMHGRKVIVVGTVTSSNPSRNGNATYVNISTHAIIEVPTGADVPMANTEPQQELTKAPTEPLEVPSDAPLEESTSSKKEESMEPVDQSRSEPTSTQKPKASAESSKTTEPLEPPIMKEIRNKVLFLAGVSSAKQTIPEQKAWLKASDMTNFITKYKLDEKYGEATVKTVIEDLIKS